MLKKWSENGSKNRSKKGVKNRSKKGVKNRSKKGVKNRCQKIEKWQFIGENEKERRFIRENE
jgi:hypothetical protein